MADPEKEAVPGAVCTGCKNAKFCDDKDLKPKTCKYKDRMRQFGR